MKCKYCDHETNEMDELRTHSRTKHSKFWGDYNEKMKEWEDNNRAALATKEKSNG